jgi:hypothetical protein
MEITRKKDLFFMRYTMKEMSRKLFLLTFVIYLFSYFFSEQLPPMDRIRDELKSEIVQTPIHQNVDFTIEKNGMTYHISPLYDYEMYGLVTTYHDAFSAFSHFHEEAQDYINIKDISTIWGDNVTREDYLRAKFWHGEYTAYVQYDSDVNFNELYFANSHMVTTDPTLQKKIMETKTGDQIYVRGQLIDYEVVGRGHRLTSTTRDDENDNSCEIIWVTDYEILQKNHVFLRFLQEMMPFLFIPCFFIMLYSMYQDLGKSKEYDEFLE